MNQFKLGFTVIAFVFLFTGTILLAEEEKSLPKTYRLVSLRQPGSVDLVEKTLDAAN